MFKPVTRRVLVRGILELRTELAPTIGRLAARRATRENIGSLREIVARMREANGDTAVLVRLALDFWSEVVTSTGNLPLELAFNSLATAYGSAPTPDNGKRHVRSEKKRS